MPEANMPALRTALELEAQRLGFDLFGVTSPAPPPHLDVFETWLEQDRHGEMHYLASERSRERRANPRLILPECRSILVLGMRYPAPFGTSPPGDGLLRGKVAAYAWGEDYHDLLPPRLEALVNFLEAYLGRPVPWRGYTDTGPLLERDLAQRAGLGWIGKNTCLIHPRQGSFFLLAEILLGIEIPPHRPFPADRCGNCTRCLEACPTRCILPNRTIDSRRCIAYLTIELKTAIPPDLRPELGQWVFGCDICQQVCPWNLRFARPQRIFTSRPDAASPELLAELALTPEQFNRKYKASPLLRTKRRGYLRNIALAIGNQTNPLAAPALEKALLSETEPLVRAACAWALGRTPGEPARLALQRAAQLEPHPEVLEEIQAALRTERKL
jgi:epoxyqueuosine reductase